MTMWSYLCGKCAGDSSRILLWLVDCDGLGNVFCHFLLTLFQAAFPYLVLIILMKEAPVYNPRN